MKSLLLIALGIVILAGVAYGYHSHSHSTSKRLSEREATRRIGSSSCGVERWGVKTMSDSAASQVNLTPVKTTVPKLRAMPVPNGSVPTSRAIGSAETRVYLLAGTRLVAYKLEADSDIHLVLQSSLDNSTMIAEIPDPACVSSSFASQIGDARAAFVSQVGSPSGYYRSTSHIIRITGVGFFDFNHGQRGVAPNAIEIHPVLSFKVLK